MNNEYQKEIVTKETIINLLNNLRDIYYSTPNEILYNSLRIQSIKENITLYRHPVVYFIKNEYTNMIKIGMTKNITKRFKELQRSFTALGLEQNHLRLIGVIFCPSQYINKHHGVEEKFWHNYMAECYINAKRIGEWFDVSEKRILDDLYHYNIDGCYFEYKNIAIQKATDFIEKDNTFVSSVLRINDEPIKPLLYILECFKNNNIRYISNLTLNEGRFLTKIITPIIYNEDLSYNAIKNTFVECSKLVIDNFIDSIS